MTYTEPTQIEQLALAREEARLKKEVFTTMIPASAEVQEKLRGWKAPRKAYILFESRTFDVKTEEWSPSLFTLDVAGRPEQIDKVNYYVLTKKFRIIHFANFPSINSENPRVAKLARYHSGDDGVNPWNELKNHCESLMKVEKTNNAEKTELQRRLSEALAERDAAIAKLDKKKPSTSDPKDSETK